MTRLEKPEAPSIYRGNAFNTVCPTYLTHLCLVKTAIKPKGGFLGTMFVSHQSLRFQNPAYLFFKHRYTTQSFEENINDTRYLILTGIVYPSLIVNNSLRIVRI